MASQGKVVSTALIFLIFVFLFPSTTYGEDITQEEIDKYFKMSVQELLGVTLQTAGKTPERIVDIPASVVVVTRDDIETYGYRTLEEILEQIPGMYGIDDYAFGMAFGVRGFWSGASGAGNDNMIILLNGISQVYPLEGNYPLYQLPVPIEAIDRIEVIRGPMSVIYGQGAFYGAINIITNTVGYKPFNRVSLSYGSTDTKKIFLRIAGEGKNYHYVANASFFDTDGLDVPLSEMTADRFWGQGSSTGGKLEKLERYFSFSGTYKDFY
ncbi:MAG: Plug domain-containing protein, partial [bacterium]|nr:Plug domain-containing protein [bacterium]